MKANELQSPFIICQAGVCPKCFGTNLMLIENDIDASIISESGAIAESINVSHESKLYCTDCKSEFDYERHGFFVQPVDKLQQRLEQLNKQKRLDRMKNNNNPFSS